MTDPTQPKSPGLQHPLPVDPVVRSVADIMLDRSAVGQRKYLTTLAENDAPVLERINHAQQEMLDGSLYCEWLKPFASVLDVLADSEALPYVLAGLALARGQAAGVDGSRVAFKLDDAIADLSKLLPADTKAGAA